MIPYQYTYEDFQLDLIQRYKEPSSEVVVTQDSIRELNRHNYVHKMHRMLELEEITQTKLISRCSHHNSDDNCQAVELQVTSSSAGAVTITVMIIVRQWNCR